MNLEILNNRTDNTHENEQFRRVVNIIENTFEKLGYKVVRLDRVMYSFLTKKDLPRGKWRFLKEFEVVRLKQLGKKRKR